MNKKRALVSAGILGCVLAGSGVAAASNVFAGPSPEAEGIICEVSPQDISVISSESESPVKDCQSFWMTNDIQAPAEVTMYQPKGKLVTVTGREHVPQGEKTFLSLPKRNLNAMEAKDIAQDLAHADVTARRCKDPEKFTSYFSKSADRAGLPPLKIEKKGVGNCTQVVVDVDAGNCDPEQVFPRLGRGAAPS